MDLSRPAVIGITTPGNKTMLRKGKERINPYLSFPPRLLVLIKVLIQHLNQILEVTDCQ
jgi:hypothetical protein